MKKITARPESLTDVHFSYCPGCHHGIAHRLIAEVIDEMGLRERTIGVFPVGCSVLACNFFNFDLTVAAHGRASVVAAGIKDVRPNFLVFSYQGDGDMASIGITEAIEVANRGENITIIFINNAIYGMTGGQMAPTSLLGQKTTTSPEGRNIREHGSPIRMCELLNTLEGPAYLTRVALNSPKRIFQAKKAIGKAFELQLAGKGFSLVEILSACPVGWALTPAESLEWIEREMIPKFPLGTFREPTEENKR